MEPEKVTESGPAARPATMDAVFVQGEAGMAADEAPPFAHQVFAAKATGADTGDPVAAVGRNKAAAAGGSGALAGHVDRFLPVMGMVAASSAVAGIAAGTATPAAGFGLFVLLLGGLSLITLRVLGG